MNRVEFRGFSGPEYEYTEKTVRKEFCETYEACYGSLGWEMIRSVPSCHSKEEVTLHFRRKNGIGNQMELTRLQRNFDACIEDIRDLEKSIHILPFSFIVSLFLYAFAWISLEIFFMGKDLLAANIGIPIGVFGIAASIALLYVYYRKLNDKKQKKLYEIRKKYEEILKICEKGERIALN